MSHESDNGIVGRIVNAVKRHKCFFGVAGACVVGFGGAVYMKSGTENVVVCKGAAVKDEAVVIGAKVVNVSNNADVETVNRGTKSRFIEGPEIDIEQPSGPQNSKEEKKRKEKERRKWLLAALAGGAAGIKIIAMMPTPDPNENNRLPDKIPNIPTPQEKWFKWLWEKREMRFEWRPLEFVRAYADKYLEGDAKCVKVGYDYVYNNSVENMKLSECIYVLFALTAVNSSVAPGSSVTNADVKLEPIGETSLPDTTTKSDATSSEVKQCNIHPNLKGRSGSPESTQVPSDGSDNDIELGMQRKEEITDLAKTKNIACAILQDILNTEYSDGCNVLQAKQAKVLTLKFYHADTTHDYKCAFNDLTKLSNAGCTILSCRNADSPVNAGIIFLANKPLVYFRLGCVPDCTNDDLKKLVKTLDANPNAPLPEGFEWFNGKTPQSADTHAGSHCAGSTSGAKSVCKLCGK